MECKTNYWGLALVSIVSGVVTFGIVQLLFGGKK